MPLWIEWSKNHVPQAEETKRFVPRSFVQTPIYNLPLGLPLAESLRGTWLFWGGRTHGCMFFEARRCFQVGKKGNQKKNKGRNPFEQYPLVWHGFRLVPLFKPSQRGRLTSSLRLSALSCQNSSSGIGLQGKVSQFFHLPESHFGYLLLTHTHILKKSRFSGLHVAWGARFWTGLVPSLLTVPGQSR